MPVWCALRSTVCRCFRQRAEQEAADVRWKSETRRYNSRSTQALTSSHPGFTDGPTGRLSGEQTRRRDSVGLRSCARYRRSGGDSVSKAAAPRRSSIDPSRRNSGEFRDMSPYRALCSALLMPTHLCSNSKRGILRLRSIVVPQRSAA